METIDHDKLKKLHETGLKGIIDVLVKHETFKKWPFYVSILVSSFVCVLAFAKDADVIKILSSTSSIVQTVFPCLLGFSLGGYAIVVGFSNTELIKQATKTDKHSIYQILSGIFALSILIQILATILGLVVYWSLNVNISATVDIHAPQFLIKIINFTILFALLFTSLYSLILVPYVISNLFTLSQLNNFYFTIEKDIEEGSHTTPNSGLTDPSPSD